MSSPQLQTTKDMTNPERRGLKKGLYLVPSAFTAANILMGFFAVMFALRAFQLIGIGGPAYLINAADYYDWDAYVYGWAAAFCILDGVISGNYQLKNEFAG